MAIPSSLQRTVSAPSAILLVVSGIIGSGVFKKIAPMAENLHSARLVLLCWAIAGVISLIGALCTAELAAMMPGSGGEFVYFKKIYGRFFSFLFGWANLVVMRTATIAALSFVFAESFNNLFPLPVIGSISISIKLLASGLIILLSYVNHRGVVFSEKLSRYVIIMIILVIAGFVVSGLSSPLGTSSNLIQDSGSPEGWLLLSAIFTSMLSAFWGYEGWSNIGYIGEEIKNPQRNLPLALGVGTLIVMALYLALNAVYLYVTPIQDLAAMYFLQNKIAAVEVSRLISGNTGAIILSALILFTTFNCTNSSLLMSARIFYAMARDGLFIKSAGEIHPQYKTPSRAILFQGIWSIVLVWSGSFDQLTDLLIFAAFIFYGSTALGVILLRRKEPDAPRPFKVVLYPVLPAFFALFCLTLIIITIVQRPLQSTIGLGLIALGVPVYFYFVRQSSKKQA